MKYKFIIDCFWLCTIITTIIVLTIGYINHNTCQLLWGGFLTVTLAHLAD